MKEILTYLPYLAVAISCNILGGLYYSINIKNIKFDWRKLANGVIKSLIVSYIFIGTSFIFDKVSDLSSEIDINPMWIMMGAIAMYTYKSLIALCKILGVEVKVKE